jgi:hypothetical protein
VAAGPPRDPAAVLHWPAVTRAWCFGAALLVLFPLASFSTEHHWDEYFYLYSTAHHGVARLLTFEPALSDGVFPNGFFSGKLGFVALLRGLMSAFGGAWGAVMASRGVFALLCAMAAVCTAGLLRTLAPGRRWDLPLVTAVALASPIVLYLGFKTMSEVPALLCVTAACWAFATALSGGRRPMVWGLAAVAALALGTLMRVTALVGFASFVVALPLLADRRFALRRAWGASIVVVAAHAVLVAAVYLSLGIAPDRLLALAQSVTGRSQGVAVAVYAVALSVQALGLVALAGLRWPLPPLQRFALAWAVVGAVPYLLSASYVEPRFFYLAVPAITALAYDGLERVSGWLSRPRFRTVTACALLATVTVVNREGLVPLMPFELDEAAYRAMVSDLEREHPGGTVIASWLSDYCYLRLSMPEQSVALAFSKTYGSGAVFSSPEFLEWAGDQSYVGTEAALASRAEPWKYVGWTYNPSVLRVQDRLARLGVLTRQSPLEMKLLDHLTASWLWSDPRFVRMPLPATGPYRAFLVRRAGAR